MKRENIHEILGRISEAHPASFLLSGYRELFVVDKATAAWSIPRKPVFYRWTYTQCQG